MVVVFGGDLESDLNKGIESLDTVPGKIRLCFETELVGTQLHWSSLFEQIGYAAVIIGFTLRFLNPASTILVKQKNMNAHGRLPYACVKDMSS